MSLSFQWPIRQVCEEQIQLERHLQLVENVRLELQGQRLQMNGEQMHALVVDTSEFSIPIMIGVQLHRPCFQGLRGIRLAEHVAARSHHVAMRWMGSPKEVGQLGGPCL